MANTKAIFMAPNASTSTLVPSTTASDYIEVPLTSENLVAQAQTTESQIIRSDRAPAGSIRTGVSVSGSLNSEFLYGAYDELLKAALLSPAWADCNGSSVKVTGATITVDHSAKTIVASSGTPFAGLAVGDWVRLEKTGYQNDGIAFRISTYTSSTSIAYDSWTKTPTTDGSSVASVTVRAGERIENGTTDVLWTVAKKIGQAGSTKYPCYLGITIDGLQFSFQPNNVPTISFPLVGTALVGDDDGDFRLDANGDEVGSGGTNIVLSTYLASGFTSAPSNSVFSPVNKTSSIIVEGVPSTVATQFSMSLANNTSGEPLLFNDRAYGTTAGRLAITGQTEAIYASSALRTAFVADSAVRLAVYIKDGDGQAYIIDMPRVKIGGGGESIAGSEGFVKTPFTFSLEKDGTTGRAIQIIRLGVD